MNLQIWDATRIKTLKTCARKFHYRFELNRDGLTVSPDIAFGKAFASAVEIYQRDGLPEAVEFIRELELPPHKSKTKENLHKALNMYSVHYASDKIATINGRLAVEYNFQFKVQGNLIFCGHLDTVLEGPIILDQKTTGKPFNGSYLSQFQLSDQMFMYAVVAKEYLGAPNYEVIVDNVRIDSRGAVSFLRYPVKKTQEQIEEWFEETEARIRQAQESSLRPRSMDYHCISCAYRVACTVSEPFRSSWLRTNTQEVVWNPLEQR